MSVELPTLNKYNTIQYNIGLEIGLLTKITFWSLLKVPFKTNLLAKTV